MSDKVHVITVQIAVDEDNNLDERRDELVSELQNITENSHLGLRFKRYSVSEPVDEEYWFAPGMF